MDSEELMPSPKDLGERLQAEVKYLTDQNHSIHDADHNSIFYKQLEDLESAEFEGDWDFSMEPNWMVQLADSSDGPFSDRGDFAGTEAWGAIGGNIKVRDSQFKEYVFSLAILVQEGGERRGDEEGVNCPCCWNEESNWQTEEEDISNRWRVARRYHFDIDLGKDGADKKPISHLQIGGRFQGGHVNTIAERDMDTHYCLSPLDKPRIPYPPVDPALIYTLVLTQYPFPREQVEDDWYQVSRESEKKLWDPYHEKLGTNYSQGQISQPFPQVISNE
ncbi:hypothetical protein PM032_17930 [Halorubrum ezzemoulense]|uniref:hypothetical protein n=1 Tax=Halorubrum ezzemoulense TaxID=337243 RepID=UPI00232E12B5|nr:hypothetical protein [Halorubrum ezzemoulense]MDB2272846.1 hypothetical protein [Halorubrum ezzemoulense]